MKKILPYLIALLVLVALYFIFKPRLSFTQPANFSDAEADLILFWGNGCPHCQKVEDYISQNQLDSKFKISRKEVYSNQANQQLLTATAQKCPEIDTSRGVGVPLAFDVKANKCLYGDTPIIEWFQAK